MKIYQSVPGDSLQSTGSDAVGGKKLLSIVIAAPIIPPGPEGWYDPMTGMIFPPGDHMEYFGYNVYLPENQWFWQQQGRIYWLNISAIVADPTMTQWGWKSTLNRWNDDGVWAEWGVAELDGDARAP